MINFSPMVMQVQCIYGNYNLSSYFAIHLCFICSIYGISDIKLLMFHGTSMKLTFKFYPVNSLLFLTVCTDVQIISVLRYR